MRGIRPLIRPDAHQGRAHREHGTVSPVDGPSRYAGTHRQVPPLAGQRGEPLPAATPPGAAGAAAASLEVSAGANARTDTLNAGCVRLGASHARR
jgi:hypothetical protein